MSASEAVSRLAAVGRYDCKALMPQFPEDRQSRRIVEPAFLAPTTMPLGAIAFR